MAFTTVSLHFSLLTLLLILHFVESENESMYDILEKYGFPSGLLPDTVSDYSIDTNSGRLQVHLKNTCSVWVEEYSYNIRYKPSITGIISYGSISHIGGISLRKSAFLWMPITGVSVAENGDLAFQIGPVTTSFPRRYFEQKPVCQQVTSSNSVLSLFGRFQSVDSKHSID
ncbi:hypothetical protein SUGI_0038920 [Cryptomeria japonica]|uniref:uncharacterized protein LOC131048846 n=1 Tax=Cryptomeria japonica TaxID=3369 RepID=UPI002408DFBD|nr:uncharacterized protein LOC131048846 [Cryptomeria japonica]GLJ06425.1 hypothetical protein SUGI_0038920 [Cryptomeria japonica]